MNWRWNVWSQQEVRGPFGFLGSIVGSLGLRSVWNQFPSSSERYKRKVIQMFIVHSLLFFSLQKKIHFRFGPFNYLIMVLWQEIHLSNKWFIKNFRKRSNQYNIFSVFPDLLNDKFQFSNFPNQLLNLIKLIGMIICYRVIREWEIVVGWIDMISGEKVMDKVRLKAYHYQQRDDITKKWLIGKWEMIGGWKKRKKNVNLKGNRSKANLSNNLFHHHWSLFDLFAIFHLIN